MPQSVECGHHVQVVSVGKHFVVRVPSLGVKSGPVFLHFVLSGLQHIHSRVVLELVLAAYRVQFEVPVNEFTFAEGGRELHWGCFEVSVVSVFPVQHFYAADHFTFHILAACHKQPDVSLVLVQLNCGVLSWHT